LEVIQQKIEAMAEHCKWVPCAAVMQLDTCLQDKASDVLHDVPKRAVYEETSRATED
jgi:hypothetical protein